MGSGGSGIGSTVGAVFGGIPGMIIGNKLGPQSGGQSQVGGYEVAPSDPTFTSDLNPDGSLKSQYSANWNNVTADPSGLNAYTQMALGTGPTAQAQAQLVQQGLAQQQQMQGVQQQGDAQNAAAQNSLAQKYGLSSGSQASLAKANMRNQMTGQQNVGAQGAQARALIGANDAANRNQFLQGLPGQENAAAQTQMQNEGMGLQAQEANNTNALAGLNAQNQNNQLVYQQQMAAYGANKNADSMANQGSGGKK